eukprot:6183617-Pleurochrysis_carterae.AAC.1
MSLDTTGSGRLETFRDSIDQRRYCANFSCLTVAQTEQQLLPRFDAVPLGVPILEAIMASSSPSSAAAADGSTAGSEGRVTGY